MEDNKEISAETTEELDNNQESGVSEIADTNNDAEFTDSQDNEESSDKSDKSTEQSTEDKKDEKSKPQKTNADYARERRKAEHEKALKQARYDAIIEALNGVNPYTQEKMEDAADVEEYLTMKDIEKAGKDPIADYSKFLKAKAKEETKAKELKEADEEWLINDKKDFITKHPDINLDELISDELFKVFATGKVGIHSMDRIYTDYQAFIKKSEERATSRAAQVLANNAATPGKLSTQQQPKAKSIKEMSSAEFNKLRERVYRGEKIQI